MKLFSLFAVLALSATVSVHSWAQIPCPSFEIAIDESLKEIAQQNADTMFENSAVRASYVQSRIANELASIHINVDLMAQNKCSPIKTPPTHFPYLTAALNCRTALINREKEPPACDRKAWKR